MDIRDMLQRVRVEIEATGDCVLYETAYISMEGVDEEDFAESIMGNSPHEGRTNDLRLSPEQLAVIRWLDTAPEILGIIEEARDMYIAMSREMPVTSILSQSWRAGANRIDRALTALGGTEEEQNEKTQEPRTSD